MPDAPPATIPVSRRLGLSGKLLLLTMLFVLLAEVLIFVPSVANFRLNFLRDRLAAAQATALVLEASPDGLIPRELEREVLAHVGALTISVRVAGTRRLVAFSDMPPMVAGSFDLRESRPWQAVADAFETLLAPDGRTIRVVGAPPRQGDFIEVVMSERPLKQAMVGFAWNITLLSLIISLITAALVYISLLVLFVRPMRRIHAAMVRFRDAPEHPSSIIRPTGRADELGQTEDELQHMQRDLQGTLQQKARLANLGLAVAKINHDLRNILASAQLFSDRLASVPDPTVQRLLPKLLGTLDRAITLCRDTLTYGKATEPAPTRAVIPLRPLAEEVATVLGIGLDGHVRWEVHMDPQLTVDADPDQLFRVLLNLARNALDAVQGPEAVPAAAGPPTITLSARREGAVTLMTVADNGPGVPDRLRDRLFQPFAGSARPGGTGLGLAIAAELVRGHGGDIALAENTLGATFKITLPDRPVALAERRAAHHRAANG